MADYRVQRSAAARLREIFRYTNEQWGEAQARLYIEGLFNRFQEIADGEALSHPVPAEFEVNGYYSRYQKHVIYWKTLRSGHIGIVTVLHERMHQMDRFREDTP
ncbi:MAG: type II toxin-antitoxin system RelE/ParE family toxin [Saccharospirillum sp.]